MIEEVKDFNKRGKTTEERSQKWVGFDGFGFWWFSSFGGYTIYIF